MHRRSALWSACACYGSKTMCALCRSRMPASSEADSGGADSPSRTEVSRRYSSYPRLRKEIRDRKRFGACVAEHDARGLRDEHGRARTNCRGPVTEFRRASPPMHEDDLVHGWMPKSLDRLSGRKFLVAHHQIRRPAILAVNFDDGQRATHDATDSALAFARGKNERRPGHVSRG